MHNERKTRKAMPRHRCCVFRLVCAKCLRPEGVDSFLCRTVLHQKCTNPIRRFFGSKALGAALLCAILWFTFWLTAFTIQPVIKTIPQRHPPATYLSASAEYPRELLAPTLFALPSAQGFSGVFPESRVYMDLSLNQPKQINHPEFYLPYEPTQRTEPDQVSLIEPAPIPRSALPAPGTTPIKTAPRPGRIALFFSPELQPRTNESMQLSIPGELPSSIRVSLSVQPEGTVDQAFFETPVENTALAGAIRKLQFKPSATRTVGWLEIRFTPGGDS